MAARKGAVGPGLVAATLSSVPVSDLRGQTQAVPEPETAVPWLAGPVAIRFIVNRHPG